MDHGLERSRDMLACLGDASRYRIVERLARGERCVTELARDVALSQSCTTRHLQALQRVGLVTGTRAGKRVVFRLRADDPAVDGLLRWMLTDTGAPVLAPARTGGRVDAGAGSARRRGARRGSRSQAPGPDVPSAPAGRAEPPPRDPEPAPPAPAEETPRPVARSNDLEDFLL